jgi:hypothetical protein
MTKLDKHVMLLFLHQATVCCDTKSDIQQPADVKSGAGRLVISHHSQKLKYADVKHCARMFVDIMKHLILIIFYKIVTTAKHDGPETLLFWSFWLLPKQSCTAALHQPCRQSANAACECHSGRQCLR